MSIIVVDLETIPNKANRERIENTDYLQDYNNGITKKIAAIRKKYKKDETQKIHINEIDVLGPDELTDLSDSLKAEDIKRCSLRWYEGQIIAISASVLGSSDRFTMFDNNEKDLLLSFDDYLVRETKRTDVFCGKNVDGFDLPWIKCKYLEHQITWEQSFNNKPIELNKELFGWSSNSIQKVGLDKLGELIGRPKTSHGSAVYDLWKQERYEDILHYNYNDVVICLEILKLMVKGENYEG